MQAGIRLSTTDVIPGHAYDVIGVLMDTETLGLHAGRDFLLRITDWIGGRSRMLDKQSQVALEAAAKRLVERAVKLGADAVVGVRIVVQPVGLKRTAMVQAVIYGTAVRLRAAGPRLEATAPHREINSSLIEEEAC